MHVVDGACDPREIDILLRFTEASEMAKGNDAVAVLKMLDDDGDEVLQPRGRFAEYAERVSFERYREAEVGAYKWIMTRALGQRTLFIAEVIARMNGERMNDGYDIVTFGERYINAVNEDQAIGAGIGVTRACAAFLLDAYRDYAEEWKARMAAAEAGRTISEDDSARRIRRASMARRGVVAYAPRLDDES